MGLPTLEWMKSRLCLVQEFPQHSQPLSAEARQSPRHSYAIVSGLRLLESSSLCSIKPFLQAVAAPLALIPLFEAPRKNPCLLPLDSHLARGTFKDRGQVPTSSLLQSKCPSVCRALQRTGLSIDTAVQVGLGSPRTTAASCQSLPLFSTAEAQ